MGLQQTLNAGLSVAAILYERSPQAEQRRKTYELNQKETQLNKVRGEQEQLEEAAMGTQNYAAALENRIALADVGQSLAKQKFEMSPTMKEAENLWQEKEYAATANELYEGYKADKAKDAAKKAADAQLAAQREKYYARQGRYPIIWQGGDNQ